MGLGSPEAPSPGDLPNPRIELKSPALQADSLPSEPPWYIWGELINFFFKYWIGRKSDSDFSVSCFGKT